MAAPKSPDSVTTATFDLMFTFDGEYGDELCLGLSRRGRAEQRERKVSLEAPEAGLPSPCAGWCGCHKYAPIASLLGSHLEVGGTPLEQHHTAAQAKAAQLLMQYLALPTTETMLHLVFSRARRALPLSRDLFEDAASHRAALPMAPAPMHTRWSVTGATPRRPPQAPVPGVDASTPRKRRNSDPTIPVLAFATPSPLHGAQHGSARLSFESDASTPRKLSAIRSPGSEGRAPTAAEVVHSPLSYFGGPTNMPSRFLTVPQGDGGVQALFEAAAGESPTLAPDALLTLITERLDLPRAVARLVVKRAQKQQRMRDSGGSMPPPTADDDPSKASDLAVSFAAFYAVYGQHRPEENDRIRLFRLIKSQGTPWLLPSDVTELVWAVSETHAGLEFLRGSDEFLPAYVQTTSLRLLWALAGAGTQRVTLQHWRHSSVTEVLFQLDEEADINLARDYFSYNHFYVIWCLFWELDEDEDSLLQKADLLRYGSYGFSSRVIDRVWSLRRETAKDGMGYADFVYFLLAEEDKQSAPAQQYWFHVLDFDSDGYLDARDMWYFYEELQSRLEAMDEEVIAFDELSNELFDIVKPAVRGRLTLAELKRSSLGYNFISALTNVRKYLAWEGLSCEKAAGRASNLRDTRDWDLFADSEYRRLVETEDEAGGDAPADADDTGSKSD